MYEKIVNAYKKIVNAYELSKLMKKISKPMKKFSKPMKKMSKIINILDSWRKLCVKLLITVVKSAFSTHLLTEMRVL